ncbi:MAG: tRNA (guanosine(37)-N1)-methyltransferase TrmD [Patescibacteria group bacterium]
MIKFDIITIFPKIFDSYFNESILARAQKKKLIKIKIHNLRDWTQDKHKKVDDRPYGGGPGMILKVEPMYRALQALKVKSQRYNPTHTSPYIRGGEEGLKNSKVVMLTPAGKTFNQKMAQRLARLDRIILLCGRYEGFDARCEKFVDEKISIGNYVLSGGELPAMVVVEAVARQIPGVVGHKHALDEETFSKDKDYIEYPQYTRPEIFKIPNPKSQIPNKFKIQNSKFKILKVPKILLSGNHKKIVEWRRKHVKYKSKAQNPNVK